MPVVVIQSVTCHIVDVNVTGTVDGTAAHATVALSDLQAAGATDTAQRAYLAAQLVAQETLTMSNLLGTVTV